MAVAIAVDYRVLSRYAYLIYGGTVLALLYVLFFGTIASGARRWIQLGPLTIQVSEFAKISLIIILAKYFETGKLQGQFHFKDLIVPALFTGILGGLIVRQPDLGTALVYFGMLIVVIFWAGIRPLHFFLLLAPAVSMIAAFQTLSFFLWMGLIIVILYFGNLPFWTKIFNFSINVALGGITNLLWALLKPYQQQRILSVLDTDSDPLGAGYQVSQSLTAFGSGGPFGKGFGEGTQTHLKFLPEQHTDFIMTVIGEEFGFIGVLIVIGLFYLLIAKLINQAYSSKYRFDSVILIGFAAVLVFHTFVNLGMIAGIMPVTGIPLPYISYGGSFMLTTMILAGLSVNMGTLRRASRYGDRPPAKVHNNVASPCAEVKFTAV
ncbi:MAG: rod shape-determining protein RodA, partial [Candidatus Marinimicrobia bacterium]|nr:rod shape-determining protein RodA [Candidatus Neomarinimicrobiota bacterium]